MATTKNALRDVFGTLEEDAEQVARKRILAAANLPEKDEAPKSPTTGQRRRKPRVRTGVPVRVGMTVQALWGRRFWRAEVKAVHVDLAASMDAALQGIDVTTSNKALPLLSAGDDTFSAEFQPQDPWRIDVEFVADETPLKGLPLAAVRYSDDDVHFLEIDGSTLRRREVLTGEAVARRALEAMETEERDGRAAPVLAAVEAAQRRSVDSLRRRTRALEDDEEIARGRVARERSFGLDEMATQERAAVQAALTRELENVRDAALREAWASELPEDGEPEVERVPQPLKLALGVVQAVVKLQALCRRRRAQREAERRREVAVDHPTASPPRLAHFPSRGHRTSRQGSPLRGMEIKPPFRAPSPHAGYLDAQHLPPPPNFVRARDAPRWAASRTLSHLDEDVMMDRLRLSASPSQRGSRRESPHRSVRSSPARSVTPPRRSTNCAQRSTTPPRKLPSRLGTPPPMPAAGRPATVTPEPTARHTPPPAPVGRGPGDGFHKSTPVSRAGASKTVVRPDDAELTFRPATNHSVKYDHVRPRYDQPSPWMVTSLAQYYELSSAPTSAAVSPQVVRRPPQKQPATEPANEPRRSASPPSAGLRKASGVGRAAPLYAVQSEPVSRVAIQPRGIIRNASRR